MRQAPCGRPSLCHHGSSSVDYDRRVTSIAIVLRLALLLLAPRLVGSAGEAAPRAPTGPLADVLGAPVATGASQVNVRKMVACGTFVREFLDKRLWFDSVDLGGLSWSK